VFRQTAPSVFFILVFVTAIFFLAFTLPKHNAYKNSFKREYVEAILKKTFDGVYFDPKKGISRMLLPAPE
jgi:hypothetical protein